MGHEATTAALTRARELSAKQLLPPVDLETAETADRDAASQILGADAKVQQARSAVQMAEVNLAQTVITSPIHGVVIARNVDVGQTVAASFSAPTLFVIAADLSKMQVDANIDESDVGQVRPNQDVTFHVDAYPSEAFRGRIAEIRLNAATTNNVVVYSAMIDAPNPAFKLMPGMTATVSIEVARRDGVLRVATSALKFKPDSAVLAHFGAKPAAAGPAATVWVSEGSTIKPVAVKTGLSDAVYTELLDAPFAEGTPVVTRASTATRTSVTASSTPATGNPLLPARPAGPRLPGQ